MKALKITNPLYLGLIAPRIDEYAKKIDVDGIVYESLYMYFSQAIQQGGNVSEFWIVFDDDNKALAFAHWYVMGLPNIGKVFFDHVYKWVPEKEPVELLANEFREFGLRHRTPIAEIVAMNEKVAGLFEQLAKTMGYKFKRTNRIHCIMRK